VPPKWPAVPRQQGVLQQVLQVHSLVVDGQGGLLEEVPVKAAWTIFSV